MIRKYTNYPEKISYGFYKTARNELIRSLRKNKNIAAIYEYGSVKAPGVSDLDLIIIFKNRIKGKIIFKKHDIGTKAMTLIKYGTIIKTNERVFRFFQFIDKLNLKKIYGKKINTIKPKKKITNIIELISVLDWLPERILRLEKILKSNEIKIDGTLSLLNSLGYTLKLVKKIIKKKESLKLLKNVKKLRSSWYSLKNPEKKLFKTIKELKILSLDFLFYYCNYIKKRNLYLQNFFDQITKRKPELEIYKNNYIIFTKINTTKELQQLNKTNSDNKKIKIFVPIFLYPHFNTIINCRGNIAKNMKKRLKNQIKLIYSMQKDYKNILSKKVFIMEKNYKFLHFHRLRDGLLRYGFYYEI